MSGDEHGLPAAIERGVEETSGLLMNDVRVHRNADAPTQLRAPTYARKTEIHLGPGQEKHLPHEAWHVVQQESGRATPATKIVGAAVNDDDALEHEADTMGTRHLDHHVQSEGGGVQPRRVRHKDGEAS